MLQTGIRHAHAHAREARADLAARLDRIEPAILQAVEDGNFPRTAALSEGVSTATWYEWRQLADAGVPRLVEFFERVNVSLARAEMALVAKLKTPPLDGTGKADTGWIKATTTILERVHRERWGERVEVRVKVEDSMREMVDELKARMSPESFREFVFALAEITQDGGEE